MRTVVASGSTSTVEHLTRRTKACHRWFLFGATWVLATPGLAAAQDASELTAADTSSPRATLESFINACNEVHARIQTGRFTEIDLRIVEQGGASDRVEPGVTP